MRGSGELGRLIIVFPKFYVFYWLLMCDRAPLNRSSFAGSDSTQKDGELERCIL